MSELYRDFIDRKLTEVDNDIVSKLDDVITAINNNIDSLVDGTITSYSTLGTFIKSSAFYNCRDLSSVSIPNVTQISTTAFRECVSLTSMILPNVTNVGSNIFYGCSNLSFVDAYKLTAISTGCFYDCTNLNVIVLRHSSVVITATQPFTNTPFDVNGTGGKLYVPQSLITAYQGYTAWATILSNNVNNQILPIEGSPYEF